MTRHDHLDHRLPLEVRADLLAREMTVVEKCNQLTAVPPWWLALGDGTMTWQGAFEVGGSSNTSAITGGTGAYANANGVVVSKPGSGGMHTTITLVS